MKGVTLFDARELECDTCSKRALHKFRFTYGKKNRNDSNNSVASMVDLSFKCLGLWEKMNVAR